MNIETLSVGIKLEHKPTNGTEAYNMMVQTLQEEIEEKQAILSELCASDVKAKFIKDWNPNIKNVAVYDL